MKRQKKNAAPKKVPTNQPQPQQTGTTVRGAFAAAFATLWATICGWCKGVWGAIKKPLKVACVIAVVLALGSLAFGVVGSHAGSAAPAVSCIHANTVAVHAHPATCTDDGAEGCIICADCGQHIREGKVIQALGHDFVTQNATEATCDKAGYTGDAVCTRCGETQKGSVIPAKGHDGSLTGKKTATCTTPGHTGVKVCKTCQAVIDAGRTISAKGHTFKDGVCACGEEDPNWVPRVPILVNFLSNGEEFQESSLNDAKLASIIVQEVSVRGHKVYVRMNLTTGTHWVLVDAESGADIAIGVPLQAILYYA